MGEVVYLNKNKDYKWLSNDSDFVQFSTKPEVLEQSKTIVRFLNEIDISISIYSLEEALNFFLERKAKMGENVFQFKLKQ